MKQQQTRFFSWGEGMPLFRNIPHRKDETMNAKGNPVMISAPRYSFRDPAYFETIWRCPENNL